MQLPEPPLDENPESQSTQDSAAPFPALFLPGVQLVQTAVLPLENRPATQERHPVEPVVSLLRVPAPQLVHAALSASLYFPLSHELQEL